MKISIIVPAFNEEKLIAASLESIHRSMSAFSDRGWETEFVVCDNNSTDRTAELARAAGATVVFEPINQIGRARNCGARAASGDWFVFVDADSHPSRALFDDTARAIETQNYIFGGCTLKMDSTDFVAGMVVGLWNRVSRFKTYAAGSYIFCEAAAFGSIGGFDNHLFASEELDLCNRLKKLARERGKRGVILHRHPLMTSARKLHLYSRQEHLRFLRKTIFGWGRTVRSREECHTWYDGRR